jgi:hypothetical protein
MKWRMVFKVLLGYFLVFSCKTKMEPVSSQSKAEVFQAGGEESPVSPVESKQIMVSEPVMEKMEQEIIEIVDESFDPLNVSRQLFDTTLAEVQGFITKVNKIIHSQEYEAWIKILSQEYINIYSSPDYLKKVSADPLFRKRRIVLTKFRDFFMYNVVPSRANIDKVDDIEFITPTRVKIFTINAKGQRLRLYEVEKEGQEWKIVN